MGAAFRHFCSSTCRCTDQSVTAHGGLQDLVGQLALCFVGFGSFGQLISTRPSWNGSAKGKALLVQQTLLLIGMVLVCETTGLQIRRAVWFCAKSNWLAYPCRLQLSAANGEQIAKLQNKWQHCSIVGQTILISQMTQK